MTENAPARPSLTWPPPGLERMQGDLWRVAARGALGGGLLVVPIVFVATRRGFASLGPFADAWWVTLVLASVGLAFTMDALATAARILGRTSRALEQGYDLRTVAYVLADLGKDMGFLIQGARHFSVLSDKEIHSVATTRVVGVGCYTAAGVWLPLSLALTLLLAARGWVGPSALWMITLLPAVLFYLVGGLAELLDDHRMRMARRAWFGRPWAADLVSEEIATWRSRFQAHEPGAAHGASTGGKAPILLRRLALAFGVGTVVVAVPVLTLVPASAIGPVLAAVGVPRFGPLQERAARMEAFRDFRVATDPAVSAQDAGHLLQDLLYVGSSRSPSEGEQAPDRLVAEAWLPDVEASNPVGVAPHRWADEIFDQVVAHPSPELFAFLDGLTAHPGQALFSRLAGAGQIDVASARWVDPFPPRMTVATLPIPRFGALREATFAHLAAAADDLKIREVISVGFLLGDQGPTLLDNLIGNVLTGTGGIALERFYVATGRTVEADAIHRLSQASSRSARRVHATSPSGIESFVASLPAMVTDTGAVRGLRWEYLGLTTTLTPCLNLNRMVFGPDANYEQFLERAHASLVRFPSEERLYQLVRSGYWGSPSSARRSILGRILGLSMRSGQGTCGNVMRRLEVLREAI